MMPVAAPSKAPATGPPTKLPRTPPPVKVPTPVPIIEPAPMVFLFSLKNFCVALLIRPPLRSPLVSLSPNNHVWNFSFLLRNAVAAPKAAPPIGPPISCPSNPPDTIPNPAPTTASVAASGASLKYFFSSFCFCFLASSEPSKSKMASVQLSNPFLKKVKDLSNRPSPLFTYLPVSSLVLPKIDDINPSLIVEPIPDKLSLTCLINPFSELMNFSITREA